MSTDSLSFADAATTSAPRRLRVNAIARCPDPTSPASNRAVSPCAEPDRPGSHRAKTRSPQGDPSSVTADTGTPHTSDASPAGSPMVAEQHTNVGDDP